MDKTEKSNQEIEADWYLEILRDHRIQTDDGSIVAYLERISDHDNDLVKIDKLIDQLGNEDFDRRQDASRRLIDLGPVALPALRKARNHEDHETSRRARECSRSIANACFADVPLGAVRLLVSRKAVGTVKALLRYLPYCMDEDLEWDIYTALEKLGCQQGKVDAALESALVDGMPSRRAAAGCILGRIGNEQQRATVRRLLKDADSVVRLRSAQGLLAGKDTAAIPVLIELLQGPLFIAWQAEELLRFVAGEQSPRQFVRHGRGWAQESCATAWRAWWDKQRGQIDWKAVQASATSPRLVFVSAMRETGDWNWWHPLSSVCELVESWAGDWHRSWAGVYGADGSLRVEWQAPWVDLELPSDGIYEVIPRRNLEQILFYGRGPSDVDPLRGRIFPDTTLRELDAGGATLNRREHHEPLLAVLGRNPKALFQVADEDLPDPGAVIPTGEQEPRVRFKGWLPNGSWGVVSSDPDDTTDKTGLMREYGRTRTTEPVRLAAWDWDGALPLKTGGWLAKQDLELREINGRGQVVWKAALPRHQQGVRETGWCCFDRVANKNTLLGFREDPHEGLTFGVRGAYAPVWKSRVVEVNAAGRAVMDFTTEDKIMGVHSCFVLIRFGFDSFQPEGLDLRSADSLVQRLDCADPRTRALAAFTLHCLSERQDTEKVVARLGEQIGQPEWLTAEHIRNLLIEDMPDKGVPALSKALKHTDPRVRVRAVESLHRYLNGKRSPELKGPILDCLSDPDPRVVAAALRVWPFDEYQQSMARLKVLLKAHSQPGGDPDVFYETVLKLADLDPRLADLEPSVIAALKGADIRFKRKAAGLVYRMRRIDDWPPEVRKAVVRCLLAQKDADLRAELLCCLENMTAPPKEVMDEVIKILGQPAMFGLNDTTKLAAVAFCHRAQSETAAAIPALILVLASPRESSEMRGEVADCLREKWPKDPRVRRALQKASNDPD